MNNSRLFLTLILFSCATANGQTYRRIQPTSAKPKPLVFSPPIPKMSVEKEVDELREFAGYHNSYEHVTITPQKSGYLKLVQTIHLDAESYLLYANERHGKSVIEEETERAKMADKSQAQGLIDSKLRMLKGNVTVAGDKLLFISNDANVSAAFLVSYSPVDSTRIIGLENVNTHQLWTLVKSSGG